MSNTPTNPIRVRLTGLADLAPESLRGLDFPAWLTAPIAGDPLYKRILSVLLPLSIQELVLEPGPVSDAVLTLFEERPIHNLRARMSPSKQAASHDDVATLLVPLGGLLEADLCGLQARGERTERIERTPVHIPGQDSRPRPEIVYLPPGRSQNEFEASTPATDVYSPTPPILRPTNTSVALRELAQRALEGDLAYMPPTGDLNGELLMGQGAEVSPAVRIIGRAAVGARSIIHPGCVLGPGAIIGEDCQISRDSHVIHSIVLDGSTVESDERLLGVIRLPSGSLI